MDPKAAETFSAAAAAQKAKDKAAALKAEEEARLLERFEEAVTYLKSVADAGRKLALYSHVSFYDETMCVHLEKADVFHLDPLFKCQTKPLLNIEFREGALGRLRMTIKPEDSHDFIERSNNLVLGYVESWKPTYHGKFSMDVLRRETAEFLARILRPHELASLQQAKESMRPAP